MRAGRRFFLRLLIAGLCGVAVAEPAALGPRKAHAVEIWSDAMGTRRYSLDAAMKWTSILSHAPADTILFPEAWSASNLLRFRLTFQGRPAHWLDSEVAYEHRARTMSEGAGAGGGLGILFPEARAPYRVKQADAPLVEIGSTFSYRHELDRLLGALQGERGELRIGRQAVGWGRGVFFGAVDIFAPFTPLEVDREWRRGIDAVRGMMRLTHLAAIEVVAAFGESWDESAIVSRLQGRAGRFDGELAFGKRARDGMVAASGSLPVLDAEVHGEFALFRTQEDLPYGGAFGSNDLVAKTVLGTSYSRDLGRELYGLIEYHHSGFGVRDIADLPERLMDPDFQQRILRGDTQILGRHAVALQLSYGGETETPVSLGWVLSASDGSGVFLPSATWIFSDDVTFIASAQVPHGSESAQGTLRSEYGGGPISGILQANFYY